MGFDCSSLKLDFCDTFDLLAKSDVIGKEKKKNNLLWKRERWNTHIHSTRFPCRIYTMIKSFKLFFLLFIYLFLPKLSIIIIILINAMRLIFYKNNVIYFCIEPPMRFKKTTCHVITGNSNMVEHFR